MNSEFLKRVSIVCILAALLGETSLRLLISEEREGGLYLAGKRLRPYKFPSTQMQAQLASYLEGEGTIEWSATLGWTPRRGATSGDGRYAYDDRGIRISGQHSGLDEVETGLRVALFGDSFMHSSDVNFELTLGRLLELELLERGAACEILNLGVPGYGMDQALLRYEEMGSDLEADVVVFGLQFENSSRNMNLCRALLTRGSGIPYTKPRYTIGQSGLELRNYPTPSPDELLGIYDRIEAWDQLSYETYYHADDYRETALHGSYLLTVALHALRPRERPGLVFEPGSERVELIMAILGRFRELADARGHRLIVLHLPIGPFIDERLARGSWPYQEVLATIESQFDLVDPGPGILDLASRERSKVSVDGSAHYSGVTNGILARYLADRIH